MPCSHLDDFGRFRTYRAYQRDLEVLLTSLDCLDSLLASPGLKRAFRNKIAPEP